VIVFRNYIDAAVVAYIHSATLEHLISVEGLASITRSALRQFQEIDFQGKEASEKGFGNSTGWMPKKPTGS